MVMALFFGFVTAMYFVIMFSERARHFERRCEHYEDRLITAGKNLAKKRRTIGQLRAVIEELELRNDHLEQFVEETEEDQVSDIMYIIGGIDE